MPGLEVNEADDGLVVYDPRHGQVHHLNPSAAVVFDLCDGSRSAEEIAVTVGRAWGLDRPPLAEVEAGLQDLAERHLIAGGKIYDRGGSGG